MRTLALALLFLFPIVSFGQGYDFNPDSLQAFIDRDKNCSDFQNSMMNAQSHYKALQIIMQDSTADPHGLDRDGNGYACEGNEYNRVLVYGEYVIRTQEVVHSIRCDPLMVDYWLNLREWASKMENAPLTQIEYMMTLDEAECVDTIFEIYSETKPQN